MNKKRFSIPPLFEHRTPNPFGRWESIPAA